MRDCGDEKQCQGCEMKRIQAFRKVFKPVSNIHRNEYKPVSIINRNKFKPVSNINRNESEPVSIIHRNEYKPKQRKLFSSGNAVSFRHFHFLIFPEGPSSKIRVVFGSFSAVLAVNCQF
uniref:Uncharacterized protein n=1 Tax=Cacopsylla melanoneura TaxID=428564 RepID=A0A8D9AWJ6_9HEMI